jgi:glycosyltransferase involved in cell wall biosynthesis
MKKIKILRIITRLNTGGPSLHVTFLEKGLKNKGYKSLLYTGRVDETEGSYLERAQREGVEIVYNPVLGRSISFWNDGKVFWHLFNLIRTYKPHIVHTHMSKAGFLGRLAAILNGVPLIFHTFHGHVFKGYFSKTKTNFYIFLEKLLAKYTTRLITLTPNLKKELTEIYKIAPEEKFAIIPLGFTFENLNINKDRNVVRNELHTPQQAIVLTIVARLVPIKNHSFLLKVFSKLKEKRPEKEFYLWIVGDGLLKEELIQQTKTLGIEKNVRFLGWKDNLGNIYNASDLAVLTSNNEGLPVALIEAMSVGKKVISSCVGGVSDLVKEPDNGYLFEPENENDFLNKLLIAIDKRDFSLSEKQRKIIRKKYHASRLIDDIDRLYQSELRKKTHFIK